jgi:hypothetical protein
MTRSSGARLHGPLTRSRHDQEGWRPFRKLEILRKNWNLFGSRSSSDFSASTNVDALTESMTIRTNASKAPLERLVRAIEFRCN